MNLDELKYECALAALARKDAEIAKLRKDAADWRRQAMQRSEDWREQYARAERVEARVREAPVVEAEPFREAGSAGSYPYAAIALTGETAKRIGGKRVALVLLDTEEAK